MTPEKILRLYEAEFALWNFAASTLAVYEYGSVEHLKGLKAKSKASKLHGKLSYQLERLFNDKV